MAVENKIESKWEIQSLVLYKNVFTTLESAKNWVKEHNFKVSFQGKEVDETDNTFRFRQEDPSKFNKFRTKKIDGGVNAIFGKRKATNKGMEDTMNKEVKTEKKSFFSILKPDRIVDDTKRTLRAEIVTATLDRDGDIIVPMAFEEGLENYKKNPIVLWSHNPKALPVGKANSVLVTESNVIADIEFADTDIGRDLYKLYS